MNIDKTISILETHRLDVARQMNDTNEHVLLFNISDINKAIDELKHLKTQCVNGLRQDECKRLYESKGLIAAVKFCRTSVPIWTLIECKRFIENLADTQNWVRVKSNA